MQAQMMALTANLNTGKRGKKFSPDDFLPKRKKRQDWREMKALLKEAFGG